MSITCQIWFNTSLENYLTEVRRSAANKGLCSSQQGECRPHITLGHWNFDSPDEQAKSIEELSNLRSFPISFEGVGQFVGELGSAFLLPGVTQKLSDTYRDMHAQLGKSGKSDDPYYTPEKWTPHCMMAFQVTRNQLLEVTEFLLSLPLPLMGTAEFIAIIDKDDGTVLSKISLL